MKEHTGVEAAKKTSRAFAGRRFSLTVLLMCDPAEPVTAEG